MTRTIELAGISVVAAGSFNPAIFHPSWFVSKALMPEGAIEDALHKDFAALRDLAAFTADWLSVQVTMDQAVFSTVDEGRELDLRDLAKGVFDLLPETPINAVGINADAHFRTGSEEEWHAIGDHVLPKDVWQPLFEGEEWKRRPNGLSVGMRTVTVEAWREDIAAFVRTEIAPSVRLAPHGVYIGVNAHFQLTHDDESGSGYTAARALEDNWEASRKLERDLVARLVEIT